MNTKQINDQFNCSDYTPDPALENLCAGIRGLAHLLDRACPDCPEKAYALIKLGETLYWSVASITGRDRDATEERSQQKSH